MPRAFLYFPLSFFLLWGCDFKFEQSSSKMVSFDAVELTCDKWQKFGPAWSPDGKTIAYSVERVYTNLGFRYFSGNILTSPEWYVNDLIDFNEFDISPNDQYVAYERDNQLWLADLREGITSLLAPDHLNVRNPALSHGGVRTSRRGLTVTALPKMNCGLHS